MPDTQIDRVIRSIETNKGVLTNALSKEIPALQKVGVWNEVVDALKTAFQDAPNESITAKYRLDLPQR